VTVGSGDEAIKDSVALTYALAREEYNGQTTRLDGLTSKAGYLLGLASVFLGLTANVLSGQHDWRWLTALAMLPLVVALVIFILTLKLRAFQATPKARVVWDDLVFEPEEDTMLQVISNTVDLLPEREDVLRKVEDLFEWGLYLTGAAAIVVGVSLLLATVD
jgi:MFS family permease